MRSLYLAAALSAASPALAQVVPLSAPQPVQFAQTVPTARDIPYPGTMRLDVDVIVAVVTQAALASAATQTSMTRAFIMMRDAPAGARDVRLRLDAPLAQPPELREGAEVHQAVPADGEWPERERDGIELGMDQHGGRCEESGRIA